MNDLFAQANSSRGCSDCLVLTEPKRLGSSLSNKDGDGYENVNQTENSRLVKLNLSYSVNGSSRFVRLTRSRYRNLSLYKWSLIFLLNLFCRRTIIKKLLSCFSGHPMIRLYSTARGVDLLYTNKNNTS